MNNNENLNLSNQIEELSYLCSLVSNSLSAISNSVYHCPESKTDNAESLNLVKISVDSIKEKLIKIWQKLPKGNNE